jgi:hypothetical protein
MEESWDALVDLELGGNDGDESLAEAGGCWRGCHGGSLEQGRRSDRHRFAKTGRGLELSNSYPRRVSDFSSRPTLMW